MKNTQQETKVYTLSDVRTAMSQADDARANADSLIACEYLDAMKNMDSTFKGYNDTLLASQYATMNTLADVFTRRQWSPIHSQWDNKHNCFKAVERAKSFDALAFIEAKDKIDKAEEFTAAVKALADALTKFVRSEITFDTQGGKKAVPVSVPVSAMAKVMEIIGIDGVIARNRDARFMAYSCTGGSSSIGNLRDITPSKVATQLVEVYHVQMSGLAYGFEADTKPATK